jgi:hypothetical protein
MLRSITRAAPLAASIGRRAVASRTSAAAVVSVARVQARFYPSTSGIVWPLALYKCAQRL